MSKILLILLRPCYQTMAIKVALIVGKILFGLNHGQATLKSKMTSSRWVSGVLTYMVPYCVSLHGQYSAQKRRNPNNS